MTEDTSDIVLGVLMVAVLLPVLYYVAKFITIIGDAWSARIFAPLAAAIDGTVKGGTMRGRYQGHDLRVSYAHNPSLEWEWEEARAVTINAFYIEVMDLPGHQDWKIRFYVFGTFGQGPKKLVIEAKDFALGERLAQSSVLAAVYAVSAPTDYYLTVAYDARSRILTYTDDVSPRSVPLREKFAAQLELVARLVAINGQVNAA
jgi:hypothetical protein